MKDSIGERIARARKAKGFTQNDLASLLNVSFQAISSWENGLYVPDTWNLIELAKVLDVSVSSLVEINNTYAFKTKKSLYNIDHMYTFINASAKSNKLKSTVKALDYARKAHEGQTRKKSDIPYIYHPLNLACHILALGILDDDVISACLLHDVVEDCNIGLDELPFNDEIKRIVKLLTRNESTDDKYYKAISKDPKASLIKCIDRCNNLTTMSWGFSRDKIYSYISETEKYILPLIKGTLKRELDYNNAAFLLSYQIESMLDIYKRLM